VTFDGITKEGANVQMKVPMKLYGHRNGVL
jgi:hypothetical protein